MTIFRRRRNNEIPNTEPPEKIEGLPPEEQFREIYIPDGGIVRYHVAELGNWAVRHHLRKPKKNNAGKS